MSKTEQQRLLIEDFRRYILIKGYAKSFARSVGYPLKECLVFMSERGLDRLEDINTEVIKAYHEYLECRPSARGGILSPFTIIGYFFVLKLFFDYAQKINLIQVNPMNVLRYAQPRSKPRAVITKEEVKVLYEACRNEQERAILALFYGCGLRREEGVKLNIRDIDFRGGFLYIRSGKGNKRRVVPMSAGVIKDLKAYYHRFRGQQISRYTQADDESAFMLNGRGTRMRGGSYHVYFKSILKRTEIAQKISLHHLRHSIATHLLAGGMEIEKVRDFLGHRYLETTQIYTRVSKEQLQWE
jgi:integrase/recombinase XerD